MNWNSETSLPLNRVLSDGFNISAEGEGMRFGLYCRAYEREGTQFSKYELQESIRLAYRPFAGYPSDSGNAEAISLRQQ